MAYIINDTRGQIVAVIEDGTIDTTSTDLYLVGRGVTDYGTAENENLVWLMENFANDTPPLTPIVGQLWYNISDGSLNVRTLANTWEGFATEAYVEAQKISPVFTGVPTAPTASTTNSSTQLATTAFVQAQKVSPSFTGVPTAPTAPLGNSTTQIATTEFVQTAVNNIDFTQYALINSPTFTGTPTAPGPATDSDSLQIATTAFVQTQKVSPIFTGTPRAPTAAPSTANTQIATTAYVTTAVNNVNLSVYAPKVSPTFTGIPLAPTAAIGTNSTQIATTQFVTSAVNNIDLGVYAPKASPTFTGTPTAPTAAVGTNTTQLATTAFVQTQLGRLGAGDATLGTVQTFTALKYFAGGIVAGSASAPNNASYNFYDSTGTNTDTAIYYSNTNGTLNVALQGSVIATIYPTNVTFNQQVRVPSTGIRFSDGTVQTTATSGSTYTLPTASTITLGGVKVDGSTIVIANGVISAVSSGGGGDANLAGTQTFTGQKSFTGGIIAGSASAPGYASYNFYTNTGTDTSLYYYPANDALTVALHGSSKLAVYPDNTTFLTQVRVPSTGIRFSDGTVQTTASSGGGGGGSPGGANGELQINVNGVFGASTSLTWDSTNKLLQINGARFGTITDGPATVAYVIGNQYAGLGIQTPREVGVVLENNALRPTQLNVDSGSQAWNWRNLYVKDNFVWNGKTISAPGTSTSLFLRNDGTWATPSGGGGSAPAGGNTQIQFNSSGSFGATANLTWNATGNTLTVGGARVTTVTDGAYTAQYLTGNDYVGVAVENPSNPGQAFGVVADKIRAWRATQVNVDLGVHSFPWKNFYLDNNLVWNGKTISAPASDTTKFLRNDGTWATVPASGYTLPTASTSTLGGVKVDGTTVTINGSGVITANMQTAQGYYITGGLTETYGYTDIVGQFSNSANYFDVFPPAGYTMSQFAGGMVSIGYIYFNGTVDKNDALRCIADRLPDRFRVYVQNTEQRAAPSANWVAFWNNA